MERMELAHRNLLNERVESFETRFTQVQEVLGRIEICVRTRVEERQSEPEPERGSQVHEVDYGLSELSLGVLSDFSGNS